MKLRNVLLIIVVLLAALVPMAASAQGNGGNQDCPAGTTLVAKFNWNGQWDPESGGGVVTITGNAVSGTWTSTVFISAIVVKGGPDAYIANVNPAAKSGTYTQVGLPPVGKRKANIPAISNIKFCAGEQPPPPPPSNGACIVNGVITPDLRITGDSFNGTTATYTITNTSATLSYPVGAASYKVYSNNGGTPGILDQSLFDSETTTVGPNSSVVVSVDVPACAFQVDIFCGPVVNNFAIDGFYGNRKIPSADGGFNGAWYGPLPEGSWANNLCQP